MLKSLTSALRMGGGADRGLRGMEPGLGRPDRGVANPDAGRGHSGGGAAPAGGLRHGPLQEWGGRAVAVCCGLGGAIGALIEQRLGDVDRADAVDHAVVGLGDNGPVAVGELQHHHLPERLGAVEPLRVVLAGPPEQLLAPARRRQAGGEDVAVDREERLLLPAGEVEAVGVRGGEALAVAGQARQPADHVLADPIDRRGAPAGLRLEQDDATDVHVGALVGLLELEEGGVEGGELLGHVRSG